MIKLPEDFTATKYPGYFWNVRTKKLYSIKIGGVLKPLTLGTFIPAYSRLCGPYYRVSVKGTIRYLMLEDLNKLTVEDSVIEVEEK